MSPSYEHCKRLQSSVFRNDLSLQTCGNEDFAWQMRTAEQRAPLQKAVAYPQWQNCSFNHEFEPGSRQGTGDGQHHRGEMTA